MSVRVSLIIILSALFLVACIKQQETDREGLREGLHAAIADQKHEEAVSLYLQLQELEAVTDEETLEVLWLTYFCFDNLNLALDLKGRVQTAPDKGMSAFPEIELHHLYARVSCQSGIAGPCRDHAQAALELITQKDEFSFYHYMFRPELERMLLAVNSQVFYAVDRSAFEYEPCSAN